MIGNSWVSFVNLSTVIYFFSVEWFEVHEMSTVNETQLIFSESMSLKFFSPPFSVFEFKVQTVIEHELIPRAANCPRTPIFFLVLCFKFLLHRLRRCNLSPCCKLSAERKVGLYFCIESTEILSAWSKADYYNVQPCFCKYLCWWQFSRLLEMSRSHNSCI